MDRTLPFAQTARELELVSREDEAYQVSQQAPAIFLRGVDGLVPLFVRDEERVILQELFAALCGGEGEGEGVGGGAGSGFSPRTPSCRLK